MEKFRDNIEWFMDYYFLYFLYSDQKLPRYHRYMINKWGDRYSNKFKRDE